MRENIVLAQPELWELAPIVRVACSDDETDAEQMATGKNSVGHSVPCCIRSLAWRSQTLEDACILVDEGKTKAESRTPRSSKASSSKAAGRPCRPRIRCEDRPVSQIAAPAGLPVDCYSKTWLNTLTPLERREIKINPVPILNDLIPKLERI